MTETVLEQQLARPGGAGTPDGIVARRQPVTVSVAIPAFNAEATLDETLMSVRSQTYTSLEIFVVDDGSRDGTLTIARRHEAADPRVTVIWKPNGGVGSARNAALARASGAFFATIDADDLWHPCKIERQLALMERAGSDVVLSYTWYAYIDQHSRILSTARPSATGDVISTMCRGNLIGNGSSPMMRTEALRAIGGWNATLCRGNEDYDAFFRLAEIGKFAVLEDFMLGYRQSPHNLSSNAVAMVASYDEVVASIAGRHLEHRETFSAGRQDLILYLFDKAVLNLKARAAAALFREVFARDRAAAARMLLAVPKIVSRIVIPLGIRARLKRPAAGGRAGQPIKGTPFLVANQT